MLKEKRESIGLTQLELAERISRHESYISKIELHPNKCNPNVKTVVKLSEELGLHRIRVFEYFAKNID